MRPAKISKEFHFCFLSIIAGVLWLYGHYLQAVSNSVSFVMVWVERQLTLTDAGTHAPASIPQNRLNISQLYAKYTGKVL